MRVLFRKILCGRRLPSPIQPSTLNPQLSTLNPQPSTLNPQPSTLNSQAFWLGDTLWRYSGDNKDLLFDKTGLRLQQWKEEGRATLIKEGSGRTIHHVRLPNQDLFIKHFRATSFLSLLHQMLRRGRAEKEYTLAQLLQQKGVSTIQPIAMGERRSFGLRVESYLLTEAIQDGLTLYELIERCFLTGRIQCPAKHRFFFARELAKLAATIHEAGIEHRDLHERNLIVRPTSALDQNGKDSLPPYQLFLLDLHELRLHRRLSWRLALQELARAGRYFTLRTTRTDRLRFFEHYAQLRKMPPKKFDRLVRQVELATIESRADFWRRRDRRPRRKYPWIREYRIPGVLAYASKEIPEEIVLDFMQNPDAPLENSVKHWWKIGRFTRVAEVELPTIQSGETMIYKKYLFKGWHESLAALVHPNQASRAWKCGSSLLLRELPTPRPILLIHKLVLGMPVNSYLLTQRVPDAMTITEFLDRHLAELCPGERKRVLRGVLTKAAFVLRTLHERRVTHRDLKASNILLTVGEDPADPDLWFVDLDSVQTWQTIPERLRLQNLSRFHVNFFASRWLTLTDRLRFLKIYLGHNFRNRSLWKSYWREIQAQTSKKILRNLRQGRAVV